MLQHVLQICTHPNASSFATIQMRNLVTGRLQQKIVKMKPETQFLVHFDLPLVQVRPTLEMSFDEVNMSIETLPMYPNLKEGADELERLLSAESVVASEKGKVFSIWLLRFYIWCVQTCR